MNYGNEYWMVAKLVGNLTLCTRYLDKINIHNAHSLTHGTPPYRKHFTNTFVR